MPQRDKKQARIQYDCELDRQTNRQTDKSNLLPF